MICLALKNTIHPKLVAEDDYQKCFDEMMGGFQKWVSAQVSNWTDGVQLPRPQTVYATSKYVNQDVTNNKIHNPG